MLEAGKNGSELCVVLCGVWVCVEDDLSQAYVCTGNLATYNSMAAHYVDEGRPLRKVNTATTNVRLRQ